MSQLEWTDSRMMIKMGQRVKGKRGVIVCWGQRFTERCKQVLEKDVDCTAV